MVNVRMVSQTEVLIYLLCAPCSSTLNQLLVSYKSQNITRVHKV